MRCADGRNTSRRGFRRFGGHGRDGARPPRRTGIPWTMRTRRTGNRTNDRRGRLEQRRLDFEPVAASLREDLVLLEDFLHVEQRHGSLDFLRPPAAAERSHARVDEAEHVQLRDEVRDPPLRQRRHPGLPREVAVRRIDLARRELRVPNLLVQEDAQEDELRLRREALHRLDDRVELDLVLRPLHMLLRDVLLPLAFGELRADPQEVEGPPRVAVLLRREGRDQLEHAIRRGAVLEREPRALREDVVQLVRVVRREDHLLVRQARTDARVEVFREGQLVRDADQRDARLRQVVVDLQELVQDVVPVLLHELVDLVQRDDHDALLLVELLQEQAVHAIRRQARERDPLMEVLDELVPDRLEHAVRRVDDLAIQVEVLDHPRSVGLAELVLDVLDDGRLPGPRLPEDEDVARTLALQRRHQDLRELSDVTLPVRKSIRQVRRTEAFPVPLHDRPSAKVRWEDAS